MTELGRASSERGWIGFALTRAAEGTPHVDVYRPKPSDLNVVRRFPEEISEALGKVASYRDDQAKALTWAREDAPRIAEEKQRAREQAARTKAVFGPLHHVRPDAPEG